jgi:hypothetical protein
MDKTLTTTKEAAMATKTIDESGTRQIVATVMGRRVTRGTLHKAFARVENREHWKNPVDAVIDIKNDREKALIAEAVVFYTGSVATFTPMVGGTLPGCRYRVTAIGYFAAVGA